MREGDGGRGGACRGNDGSDDAEESDVCVEVVEGAWSHVVGACSPSTVSQKFVR